MSGIAKKLSSALGKIPYDISTFALDPVDSVTLTVGVDIRGLPNSSFASNDGTHLIVGYSDSYVGSFQFSTPYDLSTISSLGDFQYQISTQNTDNMWVSSNGGTAFFGSGDNNYELVMATAWDVTSYSSSTQYRISTDPPVNPKGVDLNDTGTKIFFAGAGGSSGDGYIFEYSMSPGYDWADLFAGSKTTYDLTADIVGPVRGFKFSPDGLLMHVGDGNTIKQFKMTTAFDVSTASFDFSFDPNGMSGFQDGHFTFIEDGNKLLSIESPNSSTVIIRIFE